MKSPAWIVALVLTLAFRVPVQAQDEPSTPPLSGSKQVNSKPATPTAEEQAKDSTERLANQSKDEIEKISKVVDQDPRAKSAAAGILQPIYLVAEHLAFPAFHWLAFALMSAGVVSYALQLVLGKFVVLTRMGFSLPEVLSDGIGLAISLVGLVLTTQAAAENSTFTQSPFAVLSSAVVGAVVGFILYRWGQAQELQAVEGRKKVAAKK